MSHRERVRQRGRKTPSEQLATAGFRTRPSIDLTIDELVLSGSEFPAPRSIAASFHCGLTNIIGERGLPENLLGTSRDLVETGAISLRHGTRADRVGSDVAQSVYGALNASNGSGREPGKR